MSDAAAGGVALVLVFSLVRRGGGAVHAGKNQLADASAGLQADGQAVGVVQFERNGAGKAGVDPACILDEEADAPDGAASLDKGGQVVGQANAFEGGGQQERMRRDDDFALVELLVFGGGVQANGLEAVFVDLEEMAAQAQVDGGGLDLVLVQRFDAEAAVG